MERSQDQKPQFQRRPEKAPENQDPSHLPPPPQKCPRCDSSNTKFCYYNNYSLTQPRYFCKACRRYWTQGGTLRNVPIGGGCRKSKRPKLSTTTASSSASEIARTQTLTTNGLPGQQNFTGMAGRVGLTQVISPMGNNSFYASGPILSSFAAMQSLPSGGAQLSLGGGGGGRFGALLNLSSLRADQVAAQQFQANSNDFYPSAQQGLIPPLRPLNSWTQGFINGGAASTSAASPTFWSGAAGVDGGDQAGSSFNPNRWPYDTTNPGSFNHPPQ